MSVDDAAYKAAAIVDTWPQWKRDALNRHIDARKVLTRGAPTISVLIPVYNGERYLAEAIESVLAQTHQDFELIIVDDGSTDRTAEIIKRFVQRDHRVRFIRQANLGSATARNIGLEAAQGEWVALLDHDDVMLPERLERQMAFVRQNPDVKVVGSVCQYIDENGRHRGRHTTPAPIYTRVDFDQHVASGQLIGLNQPSVMMHRHTVIDVGGYRPELRVGQDIDLWIRIAHAGHLILQQTEVLGKYRVHTDSISDRRWGDSVAGNEYVLSCARARLAGRPEPSYAEFKARMAVRPLWRRLLENRRRFGWAMFRRAGVRIENRHWAAGMGYLAAALVLRPLYVVWRLSQQALPTRPQC